MQPSISRLQRQLRQMQVLTLLSILFSCSVLFVAFVNRMPADDVIRARGIIITDSAGRDRILIGAPLPYSKSRVRTDTAMVRKHWANRYPDPEQFMKWYADYLNSANGIVVMNEAGFDKVLLGDDLADPNTGQRISKASGLLWNDDEGFERGGLGLGKLKSTGQYRNALGLDAENGEAFHLAILEDGTRAMRIASDSAMFMLGIKGNENLLFDGKGAFTGAQYFNSQGKMLWQQRMDGRK